ncbi:E3 ubiquitin-protein ligase TRIM63-like [Siniperca chuatsi]|uniref:Tripartite motif-containing protein 54 n=1 Tax=Siniperca chuatsi TaxID=119488 RepID=A0A0P0K6Y9_SINCH|nr:E3 ubiquitin-protein ligase TRIM63-like [Siniperca chuatsi]ALK24164.1 muscle RING finger 1 [Siniperca chuatsi]
MDIQTGQVVRPLSAMESLEKQLSCPICLEMFTKPVVILPCQHNLCRGCANDLYESRNPYHYSGGTFRCPTCRFEVVLDRHGVYGLQRNLLVENIIDMYKQQQESRGGHGEDPPLKDKDTKEPKCKEHEDEHINIYCVSCQTPTCSMCKVFGQHKDCEVSPLHAVYQSQKNELRSAVELLAAGNSCVQAVMAQMDDTCKLIQENGELKKRRLGESFDLLYAILEERKGQLLEQIGQVEQQKVSTLRKLADQYKQQLQLSVQLQEKLSQNLQSCSAAEFLLSAKQLQEEAQQAARAAQLQRPEPGYESMEHLTLDTQEAEALLARMDFRHGGEEEDQEADRE